MHPSLSLEIDTEIESNACTSPPIFVHLSQEIASDMYRPTSTKYLLPFLLCLLTACGGGRSHWLGQLEHFEEMSRTDQPLCADSVWPVVQHYDHWWHPSLLRLRAYYMLGSAYRDMGEAPAALHYYQIATERADTTHADSATCATLFRVYGQMAVIYEHQSLPYEEIHVLKQCSYFALLAKDTISHILSLEHLTSPYESIGDTLNALEITKHARAMYLENGYTEYAAGVYPTAIYISVVNGNYGRAHHYMDIFEHLSGLFDTNGNIEKGRELYYYLKGLYFEGVNNLDSAEYYYRRLLRYEHYYEGYKGLLSIYQSKKNADSIVKYSNLHEEALLKWRETQQTEAVIQSSAMYNYEKNQRIAIQKRQEAERLKLLGGLMLTIALFVIFIIYRYYKSRVQEQETKIRELDRQYTNASKEHSQLVEEFQILKQEYDNSETSKEAKALIEKKQNRIRQLEDMLSKYQADLNLLKYAEREKLLEDNEIVMYFVKKTRIVPNWKAPEEEKWESLSNVYAQYMPLASAHMEKAKLSRQERLTCILTHLNFPPGDIAQLLDTGNSRISNVKRDASRKLFGDENSKQLRLRIIDIECRY